MFILLFCNLLFASNQLTTIEEIGLEIPKTLKKIYSIKDRVYKFKNKLIQYNAPFALFLAEDKLKDKLVHIQISPNFNEKYLDFIEEFNQLFSYHLQNQVFLKNHLKYVENIELFTKKLFQLKTKEKEIFVEKQLKMKVPKDLISFNYGLIYYLEFISNSFVYYVK